MWFDRAEQERKFLNYLPQGKAYRQAWQESSNFYRFCAWIASAFRWLVDAYNQTFQGIYLVKSSYMMGAWKADYSIPNEVFYLSDEENRTDVFVIKYLMKGNTAWHFQAIANAYGVDILIYTGEEFYKDTQLPLQIPHAIQDPGQDTKNVLVICFLNEEEDVLPHPIPYYFGGSRKIAKIKAIFAIIKQAQCKINYEPPPYSVTVEDATDIMPHSIPHEIGSQVATTVVTESVETPERIKLPDGITL